MQSHRSKIVGSFDVDSSLIGDVKVGDKLMVTGGTHVDDNQYTVTGINGSTIHFEIRAHPLARAVMNTVIKEEEREEKIKRSKSNKGPVSGSVHGNGADRNNKRNVQQQRRRPQQRTGYEYRK